jgi:hypothetical protein
VVVDDEAARAIKPLSDTAASSGIGAIPDEVDRCTGGRTAP